MSLIAAVRARDFNKVKEIIAAEPSSLNEVDEGTAATALHVASQIGALKIVQELVKVGMDVNSKDSTGRTPLIYACSKKDIKVVKFLLDSEADPSLIGPLDLSAAQIVACEADLELFRTMVEHGYEPDSSIMHYVLASEDQKAMNLFEWILRNVDNIDPNPIDANSGKTLLDTMAASFEWDHNKYANLVLEVRGINLIGSSSNDSSADSEHK